MSLRNPTVTMPQSLYDRMEGAMKALEDENKQLKEVLEPFVRANRGVIGDICCGSELFAKMCAAIPAKTK